MAASFGLLLAGECSAQGLDPLSATTLASIAAEEPRQGQALNTAQERALALRRDVLERAVDDAHYGGWKAYESVLGRGRCRELNRALFSYNLYSPAFGHDLWQDPYALEESADAVLGAYFKMQREALEDALGVEEWWDRRRGGSSSDPTTKRAQSYRMRVSPRLSSSYVGLKAKMPYTGSEVFNHLSVQMRYHVDESRPIYSLKFDDNERYWRLAYEPNTERFGDLASLSVRFVW